MSNKRTLGIGDNTQGAFVVVEDGVTYLMIRENGVEARATLELVNAVLHMCDTVQFSK